MSNILLLDIDQVVVDWTTGFEKWLTQVHNVQLDKPLHSYMQQFSKSLIPLLVEQNIISENDTARGWETLVHMFNTSHDFAALSFVPGANVAISELRSIGFRVIGITACGRDLETRKLRGIHLGHMFDHIHFVNYHDSKCAVFEQYANTNFMYVDDKPTHVLDAKRHGLNAFLFDDPQYRNVPERDDIVSTSILSDWGDILQKIEQVYN